MALSQKLDPQHRDEAVANLVQQFHGKPKLESLVGLLADQAQDVEDAEFQVLGDLSIATSVGAQLDGIGRILDEPRGALSDADYRVFLRNKVRLHKSGGTVEHFLEILDDLTGLGQTIEVTEGTYPAEFDAAVTPALPGTVDGVVVSRFALRAKGAGIRGVVTFFDVDGIAFDEVSEGFDDADDAFGTAVGT